MLRRVAEDLRAHHVLDGVQQPVTGEELEEAGAQVDRGGGTELTPNREADVEVLPVTAAGPSRQLDDLPGHGLADQVLGGLTACYGRVDQPGGDRGAVAQGLVDHWLRDDVRDHQVAQIGELLKLVRGQHGPLPGSASVDDVRRICTL
jgi:hypothetical protein